MKKTVTKLLALLMAAALVCSLAACSGNGDAGESTTSDTNAAAGADSSETLAPAENTAASDESEASTQAETNDAGETVTQNAPEQPGNTTTTKAQSSTADKGLTSTDKAAVIKFYQAAAKKTGTANRKRNLSLSGDITGKGAIATLVKAGQSAVDSALSRNSTTEPGVPGAYNQLVPSDLVRASAKSNGKTTEITMLVKEQTDYAKANATAGSVGHAIGVLGDVDTAIKEIGLSVTYANDGIKLTYKNPTVTATVDNTTGKITKGSWSYDVAISASNIKVKILATLTIQQLNATVSNRTVMPA